MEPGIEATACVCELLYVYVVSFFCQSRQGWHAWACKVKRGLQWHQLVPLVPEIAKIVTSF